MLTSSTRRRWRLHRLSLKIALVVSGVTGALFVALDWWFAMPPLWADAVVAALVGTVTYGVVHALVAPRMELAHATLKQIRKHQFDNLEAAHLPRGDEMNGLVWQVYRTGQVVEKEMRALRKMENYRREFLGNVSHELKTPIFSIRGFAETLKDGALEDPRVNRSFVEKILINADRLNNLARDLSEISRIETGELKMTMAPFDLNQLIREVVESMAPQAAAREVRIRDQVPAVPVRVHGDRERIRQVLTNLADNAIKYNQPGGHVEIVARRLPSGPVKVSVVDNGLGIPPEHMHRLTERFYRVDQSRSRAQGGTGLGLAIVKHILGAHGAQLVVDSAPGRGSTFGFTLETVAP